MFLNSRLCSRRKMMVGKAVVVSSGELERMRCSAGPETRSLKELERLGKLKALSDEKVRTWPNTLEAMRKKKENWKQEKREEEEKKRLDIDREEAEVGRLRRSKAIDRAKKILYDRTDKMKSLRSQQLLSEVVFERRGQVKDKEDVKQWEEEKEERFHETMMRQLKISENRDALAAEAQKIKATAIAKAQRLQLDEYRDKYMERLEIAKREGQLVLERAYADDEERKKQERDKIIGERDHVRKSLLANEDLKDLKKKDQERDILEEVARKEVAKEKERISKERKRLEKMRFEKRQATKQKLIDRATTALELHNFNENARVEKQVEELRVREEFIQDQKRDYVQKQKAAIDLSRQQQRQAKAEALALEKEETADLLHQWRLRNAKAEAEEDADEDDRRNRAKRLQDAQLQQIKADRAKRHQDKLDILQWDKDFQSKLKKDDITFQNTATEVINAAKAQNKPTYMLEKARLAKDITLQPATGIRV